MRSLVCRMHVTLLIFRFRIVFPDMLWRNSKRRWLACLTWVFSIAIHRVRNQRNRCGILLTIWKLAKAAKKFRITPSCLPQQLQLPYSLEHYFSFSHSFSSQTCQSSISTTLSPRRLHSKSFFEFGMSAFSSERSIGLCSWSRTKRASGGDFSSLVPAMWRMTYLLRTCRGGLSYTEYNHQKNHLKSTWDIFLFPLMLFLVLTKRELCSFSLHHRCLHCKFSLKPLTLNIKVLILCTSWYTFPCELVARIWY